MRTMRFSLPGMLAMSLLLSPARAADLGDPAPPLKIAKWIKGEPVELAQGKGKNIFVVEFWATWCPPCRVSIPRLTEMQKKYEDKGVVLVSVTDESPSVVQRFVEQQGSKMDYRVAIDQDQGTSAGYMRAFGQGGIPHAFIVDKKGQVVWHGNPIDDTGLLGGLDDALAQIVAGEYDVETAKKTLAMEKVAMQYFELVVSGDKVKEADQLGAKILKEACKSVSLMDRFAWAILASPQIKHRDLQLAVKAARCGYDASKGKNASIADTYARAMFDTGNVQEALKLQKQAVELADEDPAMKAEYVQRLRQYEAKAATSG